ncbi:MAG: ATP-grasp fold amidoligase family protein, partial [Panacagrimonas sp.]
MESRASPLQRIRAALRRWALCAPAGLQRQVIHRIAVRSYTQCVGRAPDLRRPRRFSEYVTHRLVYDRDPLLKKISDKLAVRRIIAETVGDQYVVPLLGTWKRAGEVAWRDLPLPAVFKPTHLSGPFKFLHDLRSIDLEALMREADGWLGEDYFDRNAEWAYLGCPRRLVAEPLLLAPDRGPLVEASVFTFHGEPVLIKALQGRKGSKERCCLWQDPAGQTPGLSDITPLARERLAAAEFLRMKRQVDDARAEMLDVSARIGSRIPLVRVDFYLTDHGLRIGELTAYPLGGTTRYEPPEWDERLGQMLRDSGLRRIARGLPPYA